MFSQELENLIQATLEDGKLEQYEKDALIKRAEAEGVDLTELEIYINSILQKRQRELEKEKKAAYAKAEKKKKEEFGRVCPNCGKQVPSMTLKCECGYEFNTQKQVSSVQMLFEKLNSVKLSKGEENTVFTNAERSELIASKQRDIISTFPVPNTKEDIIEFLALSLPNSKRKGGILGSMANRYILVIIAAIVVLIICYNLAASVTHDPDGGKKVVIWMGGIAVIACCAVMAKKVDTNTIRWNRSADVWRAKFEQVLMKGRSLRGDAEFSRQLDYYEEQLNK